MVQQVDHSAAIQRAPTVKPDPSASTQHAAALSAAPKPDFPNQSHPLTYLFAQHDYAKMLEAQSPIYGQIALRPSGTSSLAHKNFVSRAIARPVAPSSSNPDALVGLRKTKQIAVTIDPEMEKAQREAAETKKAREAKKLAAAERRKAQGKAGQQGRGVRRQKFNARLFSDEEEDLDGAAGEWDDEEDVEGEEGGRRRAPGSRRNPKRGTGGIYDEKDEDDSGFVVPDTESEGDAEEEEGDGEGEAEEEEEEEEGSDDGEDKPSSRAKRAARADDADDLEAAERQIEDRARAEKRRRTEPDDAMDVDGGGGRRRMIIESDDEE